MRDYVIMTDSCCDLTDQMARDLELEVLPLCLEMGGKEYRNLLDGSELVIGVADLKTKTGYRFRGKVTLHSDDAIYEEQVKVAEHNGTKKPAVVPVLEVTEIDDLTAGAKAGTVIEKD